MKTTQTSNEIKRSYWKKMKNVFHVKPEKCKREKEDEKTGANFLTYNSLSERHRLIGHKYVTSGFACRILLYVIEILLSKKMKTVGSEMLTVIFLSIGSIIVTSKTRSKRAKLRKLYAKTFGKFRLLEKKKCQILCQKNI